MSGSSESDPSHQSGGDSDSDSDSEGSATSSQPAMQKHPHKIQIIDTGWVLHSEFTTNLLHTDTSMDYHGN